MNLLRETTIREIMDTLDRSIFTKHGFSAKFNNAKTNDVVRIIFNDNSMFQFIINEFPRDTWTVTEAPSEKFATGESTTYENFDVCLVRMRYWLSSIVEELSLSKDTPPETFQRMRDNLYKKSEELIDPDKPFDPIEAEMWKVQLDELVAQFEHLQKENEIQQEELNSLKKDVATLKNTIDSLPKRTWVRAAGNTILRTFEKLSNSKLAETLLETTIKGLLTGVSLSNGQ